MKIQDVAKLSPQERLVYWIREREAIRLKKEAGQPRPWTDDEILDTYRFCNVRRMDDKVSKWLLENWYKPYFDHQNMLIAVALARFFNSVETLEYMGFPEKDWNAEKLKASVRKFRDGGNRVFNGAYVVRGNDGEDKISSVVDYFVSPLVGKSGELIDRSSMENTHTNLTNCYGFGSFMAGQVVSDLRWACKGSWRDRLIWAPIGPGSKKGINYLNGREGKFPISQTAFLEELREVKKLCERRLSNKITDRLEMMDYQNCMCEYRAYHHAIENIRNPKRLYR